MSIERALGTIDCLLDVFDTIEKRQSCSGGDKAHGHEHGHAHAHAHAHHGHAHHHHGHGHAHDHTHVHAHGHTHAHAHGHAHGHTHAHTHEHEKKSTAIDANASGPITAAPEKPFEYFSSLDDIEESQLVQITWDLDVLQAKWKESGLVENDELPAFRNNIGKVVEIESSDDTLQIQWENYDTCWVPAFACGRAPSGAKATIPGTNNSWLNDSKVVGADYEEELKRDAENTEENQGGLIANVEDPAAQTGNTLQVTSELDILQEKWKSTELGEAKDLHRYLGVIGTVEEVNEDDDTVHLRWKDGTSTWLPIQACMDANGAAASIPHEL